MGPLLVSKLDDALHRRSIYFDATSTRQRTNACVVGKLFLVHHTAQVRLWLMISLSLLQKNNIDHKSSVAQLNVMRSAYKAIGSWYPSSL